MIPRFVQSVKAVRISDCESEIQLFAVISFDPPGLVISGQVFQVGSERSGHIMTSKFKFLVRHS